MNKVSSEQKQRIFEEVPDVLRKLAAERDHYKGRLEAIETRQNVEKIASEMLEKGLETGTVQELADILEKKAARGEVNLTTLETAVDLVGPNMGKIASLTNDNAHSAGSASDLERFILS